MTKQAVKKLDIKDILYNIDIKNRDWFSKLSNEEKDSFEPFIVMQFLSSGKNNSEDEYFIQMTNEVLNKDFSLISKNKDLFFRLACICGVGQKTFHKFIRPPSSKKKEVTAIQNFLYDLYETDYNDDEVMLFVKRNLHEPNDTWEVYAESLDWNKDQIASLMKELKTAKSLLKNMF